jgi:hypothetical protein
MKKVQIRSTARAASFPLHRPTGQVTNYPLCKDILTHDL